MRCRLHSTRLLRSDTTKSRSTTSGPGKCRRSLEIFGFLKLSSDSALSPSNCAIGVIFLLVLFPVSQKPLLLRGTSAVVELGPAVETMAQKYYSMSANLRHIDLRPALCCFCSNETKKQREVATLSPPVDI